jgi:hypothetical protein
MTADELGTVVGLPDEIAERDAATREMLLNAGGEDGAGGNGTTLGKGPEQQAAAHLASGVLDGGQIEGLGLGPVAGDIVEVLGVGRDLLKDAPSGFDVGEVLLALIFALASIRDRHINLIVINSRPIFSSHVSPDLRSAFEQEFPNRVKCEQFEVRWKP